MKEKRGMFFTLVAILLLSLALMTFSMFSIIQDRSDITQRIETMNTFIFSLEEDIERKLYISGYRIIFLFEKRILENGAFISDVEEAFEEAFFNGTIGGVTKEDEIALFEGITFSDIKESLQETGSKIQLDVAMDEPIITISHTGPWHLTLELTTIFTVRDKAGLARWNKTLISTAQLPVEGFEDPVYLIHTNGKIFQKINQTPYSTYTNGTDIANLLDHVANMYYTSSNMSPNFLMRLEGDLQANENGIESLAYLPALSLQGVSIQEKTVVDSIYFSGSNPTKYQIQGMPSWFYIDEEHLEMYGVANLTA